MGGPGSAGSGKWRALGLLSRPEALEGPPGGPAWRRPLLTLVIGLAVVAAVLVIAELIRDDDPSFQTYVDTTACEPWTEEEITCFEVSVFNIGRSPGRARCAWDGRRFSTGVIPANHHETRTIGVPSSTGEPEVVCRRAPTG